MPSPRKRVAQLEQNATLPTGDAERFSGYAVVGLPFSSGHVLALRKFPVTSIGSGYTSVWHRSPAGHWTIYQDVDPEYACPRYYGRALESSHKREIEIQWDGPNTFTVVIGEDVNLKWTIGLVSTGMTRMMNGFTNQLPGPLRYHQGLLRQMGKWSTKLMGAGQINFMGQVPNGQSFRASPRLTWFVQKCRAVMDGEELGKPDSLEHQARLSDFWIPQYGMFCILDALFEPYDPEKHTMRTGEI